MEKPIRFTLRIVTSLDKELARLAKKAGHSKTGLITQILWEYVKQKDKTA
jgi:ribbon-helix-helix protein, copG family